MLTREIFNDTNLHAPASIKLNIVQNGKYQNVNKTWCTYNIRAKKNMRFTFVYIAFRFYWPGLIFEIFSGVDLVVDSWVRRREKVCWDQTRQYPSSDGKHNWIPSITRNIGGGQLSTFQFWLARQTHFFFANCIYEMKNCFKYLVSLPCMIKHYNGSINHCQLATTYLHSSDS